MKPRPNHRLYLQALRRMTPGERLQKVFELSELSRKLFLHGLRRRFPAASESEVMRIYRERLIKCHNRNYRLLDLEYLRSWARTLGVSSMLERIEEQAERL